MARAMYEYTKTVLQKVSFNTELFTHELQKALSRLLPYEIKELHLWLINFTQKKPELVPCLLLIENQ